MATVTLSTALKDEYQRLFDSCQISARRAREVEQIVTRLAGNRERYARVGDPLGIPWYFIAAVHNMESSQRFDRHLHNGDPLDARTVHVPRNRPRGTPPFSWEESATDALELKRLDDVRDWSLASTLYRIEGYNGWGYRLYHPHVLSPYVWGYSEHYRRGKYVADGRWSDTAVSRQCGAGVILRRMAERGLIEPPQHDVPRPVRQRIEDAEPILQYSARGKRPYAAELQAFLSTFPGVYVKPDGWPGKRTSDAFHKVSGHYLHGDPRA